MKTFTTYAEKKAKQILNLLQGYTKGIRMTAILILLLMGVNSIWADGGIYLKPNSNWTQANARFAAYFFKSSNNSDSKWMSMYASNKSGYYVCAIPDGYDMVILCRMNPSANDNNWNNKWNQTGDLNVPSDENIVCSINSGQWDCGNNVTWSKINWYIAGDFNGWNTTANKMPCDISIESGDHTMKIVSEYGDWFSNTGTMIRGNSSGWTMTYGENSNCTLTADVAGTYNFSSTGTKLTVTYPEECFLKGDFNDWSNIHSILGGSVTINLKAGTYKFKIHRYDATSAYWVSNNGTMTRDNCSDWTMYSEVNDDCKITADFDGDYTFTYDRSTGKLSVTYPTIYKVTYSHVPTDAADAPTSSISSDAYVLANTSLTFTAKTAKTGYTWKGWYNNNAGTGTALTTNKAYATTITDNTTIYAVYTANTYTVVLNQEGATTPGTASVTATYDAAMPQITPPTRTGYTFLGYWTEKEGKGTQYYNANGTSANNWDQASDDILYAHWEEAQYTVTFGVHSTGHGQILFENTSTVINGSGKGTSQQKHGASISFTATPSAGYEVEGWYSNADCTKRIESAGTHTRYNPAPVTSDVTIYVKFKEETRRIYLKPAGGNGWADGNARFAMYVIDDQTWYSMTKINDGDDDTGNDIYYCDIKPTYQNVIFCRMNPGNNTNNWDDANRWTQTKDLQILEDCNLFDVAANASTQKQDLADGDWMEYNAWQLVGSFSSWDPCGNRFDENSDGTYTYTIELTAGDYEFKLVRNGIWYGNNGDMERNGTGVQSGGWDMYHDAGDCTLKADMTGNYIFTIHKNGKLTVTYPVTGYQLKITMKSDKVYTSNSVGNAGDILSFFAPGKNETGDNAGVVELCFEGKHIQTISSATFETSNVYVAKLNANKNGITDVALYDGDYYIRTDGASGGWNDYKQNSNKMTYFVPRAEEKYSYYWVESVRHSDDNNRVNVKACVGNQYNNDLAGMLENDKFTDINGDVYIQDPTVNGHVNIERVNLRFGYNPKTNHFERAMLTGSGNINSFLNITDPDGKIYKTYKNGQFDTPLTARDQNSKFTDISNWVYERDIWVDVPSDEDVTVRLTARAYNGADNSLFGFDDKEYKVPTQRTIVGAGSTPGPKKMRVIYDFKTNRMIMAWMPGDYNCTTEETLYADVLFMRHENNAAPQINLTNAGKVKSLETMYFALEFERGSENASKRHQEQYWFTLPFNCRVGEISGVPGYMQTWGIQRYRGDLRAQKGWFAETPTFWEWLSPNDILEAGEGYLLVFDKKAASWAEFEVRDDDGNVTETRSILRLYFPSTTSGFDLQQQSTEHLTRTYENHTCTIQLHNRYLQDSNWKVIGTTSYNNAGITECTADTDPTYEELTEAPSFRYKYEYTMSDDNKTFWYKYTAEDGKAATYNSFFGYMVQFAGTIQWQPIMSETVPEGIAARRYVPANERTSFTTRLEMTDANGEKQDQTFVALDEKATVGFDQNKDLNKVLNRGTNIYTFVEGLPFAGNTLPMEKATVPVGVRVDAAGEYTFRMPDGTDGIAVTLVDNVTGTHTNMLMSEYTVTLNAGTIENRFYLVVDPDRTATSVENIGEEADKAKGVEKFLIDGKLFIRTADGIFDAKGQRL